MRRKPGTLVPLEAAILTAAVDLRRRRQDEFHGFAIAKEVRDQAGARRLTGFGTLYRALERLEAAGLLKSRWEDPNISAREHRPQRRLYEVTEAGAREAGASWVAATPPPRVVPHGVTS